MVFSNFVFFKLKKIMTIEEEILQELRGYYSTSFFHIYLQGNFDLDIENLSKQDLGTFVHEYIHYMQNISTLWGLQCSIVKYDELALFKQQVLNSTDITLPFQIKHSEKLVTAINRIKAGNGTTEYLDFKGEKLQIESFDFIRKDCMSETNEYVSLKVLYGNGTCVNIELGAHIIKESMAALYQSFIDPGAEHDDFPYNIVQLLCDKFFSSICKDKAKIICICHSALFSMQPGSTLMNLLAHSSKNPILTGLDLFDTQCSENVKISDTKKLSVIDFYSELTARFKRSLSKNIKSEIDYIQEVLNRLRIDKAKPPILSILYDEKELSMDNMLALIHALGIPYIRTLHNGVHFPESVKTQPKNASLDVLELITLETLFQYFMNPLKTNYCCPMLYMCDGSQYQSNECYENPWTKRDCPLGLLNESLNLESKNITINTNQSIKDGI